MKYLNKNKLKEYGFVNNEFQTILQNKFKVVIKYENDLIIRVFDEYDEEYLPYYVKNNSGKYVADIRNKVNEIIEDIYNKCEIKNNIEEMIYKYVKDKYNTIPDHPFPNDKISTTLKNNNRKWYGLIMEINSKKLNIYKEEQIKIMNIKLEPDHIEKLIDNINFFPAYHMSKKYWITIVLDSKIDIEKLKELIDESYQLVK
ncbi:MAG: MmcQ/YjbR family DNA-binding protein [Candidatus Coprovivens sp.]